MARTTINAVTQVATQFEALFYQSQRLSSSAQSIRAFEFAIHHSAAPEARALFDELQRGAAAHPEGVPGYVVAASRLRFDEYMRKNVQ